MDETKIKIMILESILSIFIFIIKFVLLTIMIIYSVKQFELIGLILSFMLLIHYKTGSPRIVYKSERFERG